MAGVFYQLNPGAQQNAGRIHTGMATKEPAVEPITQLNQHSRTRFSLSFIGPRTVTEPGVESMNCSIIRFPKGKAGGASNLFGKHGGLELYSWHEKQVELQFFCALRRSEFLRISALKPVTSRHACLNGGKGIMVTCGYKAHRESSRSYA